MKIKIIQTPFFGSVGIIWSRIDDSPKIVRIILSTPDLKAENIASRLSPDTTETSCAIIDKLGSEIKAFLAGKDITFTLDAIDLESCPKFQQSVLRAQHQVSRGSVSAYKLIATHVGRPNGARTVGNALANNPFPLIIPCHRTIRSDRFPGGYRGGVQMKRALLSSEGIDFDRTGRVICDRFHYCRSHRDRR